MSVSDVHKTDFTSLPEADGYDDALIERQGERRVINYIFFQASVGVSHEHAQALARVTITAIMLVVFAAVRPWSEHNLPMLVVAAYLLFSTGYLLYIRHCERHPRVRQYLSICLDLGMASLGTYVLGFSGIGLYPLFLWVMVGNGLRFGTHFLQFATTVGIVGFVAGTFGSGFMMEYPAVFAGLLVGLLLMPTFFLIMVNRLAQANVVLKRQIDDAEHMASHDALTDLPNRLLWNQRLEMALQAAQRTPGKQLAVVYLDLDNFKEVNDNHGHDYGDLLLKEIAECLTHCVRPGDTVARVGGDEFLVLIEDARDTTEVASIVEHIFRCSGRYYAVGDFHFYVTWSCGVAVYPQDGRDPRTLVKHADTAMYRAKLGGPNRFELYDKGMSADVAAKLTLREELRQAIEQRQLVVHYQPLFDTVIHDIIGAEALLRWQHPERGLVGPGAFIKLAEQTGLINQMGDFVLEESLKAAAAWIEQFGKSLEIHVNVSIRQLNETDFTGRVGSLLRETGVPAQCLTLEITETLMIEELERAEELFSELRALGVKIALDDFGTGYSSLSYLRRFKVDAIKIDQSFVRDVPGDEADCALVELILSIGSQLGTSVVAEGVETEQQWKWLRERACRFMQGYYFARPMPLADFNTKLVQGLRLPED